MEHPSIIGDELAWAILNSSRPYESNPDKVPPVDLWKCFRHDKEWAWGADSLWHALWTLNQSCCKNMNNHFELDHSHGFSNLLPTYNDEHYFIFWTKTSRTKAIRKFFLLCLDSIVRRFVLCWGLLRNNGGYKFLGLFRPGVRMSLQIRLIIIHCNL